MSAPRPRDFAIFLGIVLAAVLLRLPHLGSWDMWTDEVQTLWISQSGDYIEGPMYSTTPVNFVLTRLAMGALGANETGARAVPFACGVLAIALSFWLFKPWAGTRPALFATLVLALSMWHIYWSQTARHFSLQTLLVLVAMHAFLAYWRRGSWLGLAIAALSLLTALFVHSSSGFYLGAFLLFVATCPLARPRWFDGSQEGARRPAHYLLAASALLVALALYLPTYVSVGKYLLANKTAWNPPANIIGSLVFYIPPWIALPALAGALFLWRERNDLALLLTALAIVPVALVTALAAFTIASAAYCLATMPAIALLCGVACDRILTLASAARRLAPAAIAISAIFAAQLLECALYHTVYNGLKPRWREAAAYVAEHRAPGEMFLAAEGDVAQYYLGREHAEWFDKYEDRLDSPEFPPAGVTGVWYAIFLNDNTVGRGKNAMLRRIYDSSTLELLLPLHYGPKDRTLGVFHERIERD